MWMSDNRLLKYRCQYIAHIGIVPKKMVVFMRINSSITLIINLKTIDFTTNMAMCRIFCNYLVVKFLMWSIVMINGQHGVWSYMDLCIAHHSIISASASFSEQLNVLHIGVGWLGCRIEQRCRYDIHSAFNVLVFKGKSLMYPATNKDFAISSHVNCEHALLLLFLCI